MFLEQSEIIALTGKKKYKSQLAELNTMGIPCKIRSDGSIAVLKSVVEKEFGDLSATRKMKSKEPNWSAAHA